MPVQDTSIEAFEGIKPTITRRQQQILTILKSLNRPASNREISYDSLIPINEVTPRTNELAAKGLIEIAYKEPDMFSKKRVIHWRVIK